MKRSMYINKDLYKGHILSIKDIVFMRPYSKSSKISDIDLYLNKEISKDVTKYTLLNKKINLKIMVELHKTSDRDIKLIGDLLFNEKNEYRKYFDPFDNIRELIESHNNKFNIFYTIYLNNNVAGFRYVKGA